MGMKFDTKGVAGVLSIALPIITWLIESLWKRDKVPVIYDTGVYGDRRSQKNQTDKNNGGY